MSIRTADDILAYLEGNPSAEDTLEGVAQWWLLGDRNRVSRQEVQESLAALVRDGWLEALSGPDGRVRYRLHPARRALLNKDAGGGLRSRIEDGSTED